MLWLQVLAPASLFLWLIILFLPWRPWGTRESLDPDNDLTQSSIDDVTVLVPARNEADVIEQTLQALALQDENLQIIVVDDESSDATADIVQSMPINNLTLLKGSPAPDGWSGKLWALEQARNKAKSPLILLLDADIKLEHGVVQALREKCLQENLHLVSLMANLRMISFWERLLIPAFVYFFKLLYPFHLSNQGNRRVAAAAGGCIMLKTDSLNSIGGFAALKDALIDDCTLARKFRERGFSTWIGLTHSAISLRAYNSLESIWQMVTRTAFTQLHYSWILLSLCVVLMALAFIVPLLGLFSTDGIVQCIGVVTLMFMFGTFIPVLRYYELTTAWSLTLPVAGLLYLMMTCHSGLMHLFGQGSSWKGRNYSKVFPPD